MPFPPAWSVLAGVDIYLLDLVLRGTIRPDGAILDIGCGSGRNLPFLAQAGMAITAIDADPVAASASAELLAKSPGTHAVRVAKLPELGVEGLFDAVLCIAVLHFAPDQSAFNVWADACWRRLRPCGIFLARLSTRIAMPESGPPQFTYRASLEDLVACERRWQAMRIDPLKTTLVEDKRVMSTWTLLKPG